MLWVILITIFIFSLPICLLIFVIKSGRQEEKDITTFMALVCEVIQGKVFKPRLSFSTSIIIKGRYKNREVECRYIPKPATQFLHPYIDIPQVAFTVKPLNSLNLKRHKLFMKKITDNVKWKNGVLVYRPLEIEYCIFQNRDYITGILEELIKATEVIEVSLPLS